MQEEECELEMCQMEIADVLPAPFQNIIVDPATMAQARGNLTGYNVEKIRALS